MKRQLEDITEVCAALYTLSTHIGMDNCITSNRTERMVSINFYIPVLSADDKAIYAILDNKNYKLRSPEGLVIQLVQNGFVPLGMNYWENPKTHVQITNAIFCLDRQSKRYKSCDLEFPSWCYEEVKDYEIPFG